MRKELLFGIYTEKMKHHRYSYTSVLLTLFLMFTIFQTALSQSHGIPENVGTVDGLFNYLNTPAVQGKSVSANEKQLKASSSITLDILVNTSRVKNDANIFSGEVKGSKGSNVVLIFKDGSVEGKAVLQKEKIAYKYYSDANKTVWVEEEDIHDVICIENPKAKASSVPAQAPPSTSIAYKLQSLPGAEAVVYLDFDGQLVVSPYWNGGVAINAAPSNLTESDIIEAWKLISEDFSSFVLNITTDSTVFNAAPSNRRTRCIFTPTNTANPGSGGVAYIGSFTWGDDAPPCWAFNEGAKYAGETGSHEVGHTLGLGHDGTMDPFLEYYEGQGDWAPIMGVAYYRPLGQWSKGEYNNANNQEDDIAIIAGNNGFGFKTDEISNTTSGARLLNYDASGNLLVADNGGIIEQRSDADVFYFTTNGGNVTLNINPALVHPDLDILAKITNQSGTVFFGSDPYGLPASINVSLAAGTYYLSVEGVGDADPAIDGYSDYASLGVYTISGKITNAVTNNKIPLANITSPANNAFFPAGANITVNANASDPDGSVSSVAFYNNNILLGTDESAPYSFNITNAVSGTYQLKAIATDNKGAAGTSAIVTINVTSSNKAPVVSITSPANGITLAAGTDVVIKATATDADGTVAKVDFYDGNIFLGTDNTSPYSFIFSHIPVDGYYFIAVATDNKGAQASSVPVSITAVSPGVYGPSCVMPNKTYQYILYSDIPTTNVDWWSNGDATITEDPGNDKIAYVTFSIWNPGARNITAGADLAASPWYRKSIISVNVGGCGAPQPALMTASRTADDQILVSIDNGEKIQSVKVYDVSGKELISSENNNAESVLVSQTLPDGIYMVRALTDHGTYVNKIAKFK